MKDLACLKYKNYDHSIVNLMSSIQKHYHLVTNHSTLQNVDEILAKKDYKNVIVMVCDGMGKSILDQHLSQVSFLQKNTIDVISSVIPSTTAAATTSYLTGLTPIETGWLGWSLYLKDIDRIVDIFTSKDSYSAEYVGVDCGQEYLPYTCIGKQIMEANETVHYYELWPSFKPNGCKNFKQMYHRLIKICKQKDKKFIYVYYDLPDHDIHNYGTMDKVVHKDLLTINKFVEKLAKKTKDTVAFISADHGLIDVVPILLYTYYELLNCLTRMPYQDGRCTSFSIKKGMEKTFVNLFQRYFEGKFVLFSKKEAIKREIFGKNGIHPLAESILGDYIAIAIDKYYFAFNPKKPLFKGHHAGLTKDEMLIPLISFNN